MIMRVRRCAGLLLASVVLLAPALARADEAGASPAPFLWRIQGPHAQHYLLGSVHLLPESAGKVPAALEGAFREATGGIVLETDLGAVASPMAMTRMALAGQSPPPGLRGELGDVLYRQVRRGLAAQGQPETLCDSLRAWLCALSLELAELQRAGFEGALGLDEHFYGEAQALHRRVDWFEEVNLHLGLFTEMPAAMARDYLLGTLDPAEREQDSPAQMLRLWRGGDIAGMTQAMDDFARRYPALYDYMIARRNRAWQAKLAALIGDPQGHLIIVGVGHCVGSRGLVALLSARGVQVTPAAAGSATARRRTLPPRAS